MTKTLKVLILLSLLSVSAMAADMNVKVTSYIRAGVKTRSAELCGKVTNMSIPWVVVKVKVDANTKNPGNYNVIVDNSGNFCVAVVTNGGRAELTLASLDGEQLTGAVESKRLME
tara:strand:- start:7326 stop:7670 length:345 start_codon:yes stop_codon:yes gene_type:complete